MKKDNTSIDKSAIKLNKEEIIKRLEYNDELLSFIVDIIEKFNGIYEQSCKLTKSFNNRLVEERKEKDTDDITQDTNNTTLDELIITDELATAFPRIHNLRKNTTVLNDLITNKVSSIFWKDAFENEITNLFDASKKNDIVYEVNEIIAKRENHKKELQYKELYDTIIGFKRECEDNKKLFEKFVTYLKKDRFPSLNRFQKEDKDMYYYTLFMKCLNTIENFINQNYALETEEKRAFLTNTFNKYLSFLYILYHDKNIKKIWGYNTEDILKEQDEIIELNEKKHRVYFVKFFDTDNNILATFQSEKITTLITKAVTEQIPTQIIFNPNNLEQNKERETKLEIFNLLNTKIKFKNCIIKACAIAIIEIGLDFKIKNKEYEFVYNIIDTLIPDFFIDDIKHKYSEKVNCVKSIYRTVKEHLEEGFFCLKYNENIFSKDYLPQLTYTDDYGNQKFITSFSDLF